MKKAVVTVTIGATYEAIAHCTHPLLRQYADRVGAEFVVISEPVMRTRLRLAAYEKLQLYRLLDHYDRIAFVDSDILVAPDAPDVFERTPEQLFGAASEERYSQAQRDKRLTQEILGAVDWHGPYFNSGVMVVGRAHRDVFDPDAPELIRWAKGAFRSHYVNLLNDQPYFNHRVRKLGIPVFDLGFEFNHTRVIKDTKVRFRSHFIHYSGPSGHRYGTRLEQIRKDAAVIASPLRLTLSRRLPRYRWFADRLCWAFLAHVAAKLVRRTPELASERPRAPVSAAIASNEPTN